MVCIFTRLDVHKSVHRDATMIITNKMHYMNSSIIPIRLYMFRAMFSPIIRSTWLYLQYLVMFTQVAVGWCPEWFETELCRLWGVYRRLTIYIVQFQLIWDTSRQQLGWTLPDTVNTVKCSWWWAKTSSETYMKCTRYGTRYCKYSQILLIMGENIARNM